MHQDGFEYAWCRTITNIAQCQGVFLCLVQKNIMTVYQWALMFFQLDQMSHHKVGEIMSTWVQRMQRLLQLAKLSGHSRHSRSCSKSQIQVWKFENAAQERDLITLLASKHLCSSLIFWTGFLLLGIPSFSACPLTKRDRWYCKFFNSSQNHWY